MEQTIVYALCVIVMVALVLVYWQINYGAFDSIKELYTKYKDYKNTQKNYTLVKREDTIFFDIK